jgi:hypothetical protein
MSPQRHITHSVVIDHPLIVDTKTNKHGTLVLAGVKCTQSCLYLDFDCCYDTTSYKTIYVPTQTSIPTSYSGGKPVLNLILSAIKKANSKA